MKKTISDKLKSIMLAATHSSNIGDIAAELNVKVQVVTGSIATLKKEELATYENHQLVLTKSGLKAIDVKAPKVKKDTNKDAVAALFIANIGNKLPTKDEHKALVDLVATTLKKTKTEARVYIYNYEKAAGLRAVGTKAIAPAALAA